MHKTSLISRLLGTSALVMSAQVALPAYAQDGAAEAAEAVTDQAPLTASVQNIESLTVVGTQRLEASTVLSYTRLRRGQQWNQEDADQALKDLFATDLFADVSIRNNSGSVVIEVKENPVVNRIILEGNKRIKSDKIVPEIKLAARQIFSRAKVRADVARITELYKRKGRFAATVEPKMVQLEQNRVDIVFEIAEGPKSKVQQINIIGNEVFSDSELRGEMVTKQSRFFRFFSSGTSYDPDRLAFDQQKLRQFYLTEGYADFRVVSAVAELTPDKQDFIITYVVEEGERYKFGDVEVDSAIRDFDSDRLASSLPMKNGDWYDAKQVEDTVEQLSESAGLFGYAFADVRPRFNPDRETKTMGIKFDISESPRVFVERIDINGNTQTVDKVLRREFRLNEGDAFNSFQVKRTANRIKSLGYFQEDLEIEQEQGSGEDRIVLTANVEEKPTGELSLSAGFSSLEQFIFQGSIRNRNFRGTGQEVRASVSYSRFSKSAEIGFTEPYLFDRSISLSGDIFRRDLNAPSFIQNSTTYEQVTTGFQLRTGVPVNEFLYFQARYGLSLDEVSLGDQFFVDPDGTGPLEPTCNILVAGRFLCDAIGTNTVSSLGYTLLYDTRNNRLRPTSGHSVALSQDFAGLGGNVRYIRSSLNASKHWSLFGTGFIFNLTGEASYIHPLQDRGGNGVDDIRLVDRYYLGEPQIRGFDIRGVGPRIVRNQTTPGVDAAGNAINAIIPNVDDNRQNFDEALGGRARYLVRGEIEIPLGSGAKELGLRPSIFVDVGSVFKVTRPLDLTPEQRQLSGTVAVLDANGDQVMEPVLDDMGMPTFDDMNNPILAGSTIAGPLFLSNDFRDSAGNPVLVADALDVTGNPNVVATSFVESFFGDTWRPRVSVGIGVNWNSPFGPFRIDLAKAIIKRPGDDTKLFTFNVGTQF